MAHEACPHSFAQNAPGLSPFENAYCSSYTVIAQIFANVAGRILIQKQNELLNTASRKIVLLHSSLQDTQLD